MGPIKPHSNEKSPKEITAIDFGEDDDGEDSTLKFVIEDEESEIKKRMKRLTR